MNILHVGPVDWIRPSGLNASIPGAVHAQSSVPGCRVGLMVAGVKPSVPTDLSYPVVEWAPETRLDDLPHGLPDLVVFHSTYIPAYRVVSRLARNLSLPYIVTPRGGLTSTAQSSKRLKKTVANLTMFRPFFRNAVGYHFLTEGERDDSSSWGQPYFVAGNGVGIPDEHLVARPGIRSALRFTYVGRIDTHIKGLDRLIEAFAATSSLLRANGARLDLYGSVPGDDTHRLRRAIEAAGIADLVCVHPRVTARERDVILAESDVFVLPSRSEGHPVAALEALSFGLPCIVSEAARIGHELNAWKAGWVVDGTTQSIIACITAAIDEKASLAELGANARQLAVTEFSWSVVAQKTVAGYQEILAGIK